MADAPAMRPTGEPVAQVLDRATGARRAEADELVALLADVTGEQPRVWAGRIVGFGEHAYRYDSGREGVEPLLAFAPGRAHHTLYLEAGYADRRQELLAALGPHRASVTCLYVPRLADVDGHVLRTLLERSLEETRAR